ncbi:MAG: DUF59 domain-containing protein [Chloroflexi bacterium]|nr:DUF59 domain-containing protein [Chloroflexota bacterium]MBI3761173.1 DUF59 domain-containing protein [Chloroflexota bacterium]
MSDTVAANNAVAWQAESVNQELAATVKEKLREVIDPEIGLNVIELGLIRDLEIAPESAKVSMMLTTPFCPYGPAMLEAVRKSAQDVLNVPTTIEMSPELWDPSFMEEGAGADWGLF